MVIQRTKMMPQGFQNTSVAYKSDTFQQASGQQLSGGPAAGVKPSNILSKNPSRQNLVR